MFQALAHIALSDPASMPLLAVLAFSLCLYPLGILFPCGRCCRCDNCGPDKMLPETVTVTLTDMPDQSQGPYLCTLLFEGTFGGGALGRVTAPGGIPAPPGGPITAVEVTLHGSGYAEFGRVEPSLTITGGGSGATFTPTLQETVDFQGRPVWEVESVAIAGAGSGYTDGEILTASLAAGQHGTLPSLQLRTTRSAPTLAGLVMTATGAGGDVALTLGQTTDGDGRPAWEVTAVTVTDGGLNYEPTDTVEIDIQDGQSAQGGWFSASLTVDGNGTITGVTVNSGGLFFDADDVPDEVVVLSPGAMYGQDPTLPPLVAEVTVTINQQLPSDGDGAELEAVIDTDTASPTFGQITGVDIAAEGDGYLAWQMVNNKCCSGHYDDVPFVLRQSETDKCLYIHQHCGAGSSRSGPGSLTLRYNGKHNIGIALQHESAAPVFSRQCDTIWSYTEGAECDDLNFEVTSENGAKATVSAGGEYDEDLLYSGPRSCHACCRGSGPVNQEITVTITDSQTAYLPDGDYVMNLQPVAGVNGEAQWMFFGIIVQPDIETQLDVTISPCAYQGHNLNPLILGGTQWIDDRDDECYRTCFMRIFSTFEYGMFGSAELETSCLQSPICNPSGSHAVISLDNGQPLFTATFPG